MGRRGLGEFPALSAFDSHRPGMLATSMAIARQLGYGRAEVPINYHNALPARLGTPYPNIRPAHTANYRTQGFVNYTVAPVQMHQKDGGIFVKNKSISIPSNGIPKPDKRAGERSEPVTTYRKTERKRQSKRTKLTDRQPILSMECIEIDQDSD